MRPPSRSALELAEEHWLLLNGIVTVNYVLHLSLRKDPDGVYRGEAIATRREAEVAAPCTADSTVDRRKGKELPEKNASDEGDV